jgi:hypothetical protein
MLIVVLGNKLINPGTSCFERLEWLARIGRRVLERVEQAFRVLVVVAHRWPAERWHYAQPLQRLKTDFGLELRAVSLAFPLTHKLLLIISGNSLNHCLKYGVHYTSGPYAAE